MQSLCRVLNAFEFSWSDVSWVHANSTAVVPHRFVDRLTLADRLSKPQSRGVNVYLWSGDVIEYHVVLTLSYNGYMPCHILFKMMQNLILHISNKLSLNTFQVEFMRNIPPFNWSREYIALICTSYWEMLTSVNCEWTLHKYNYYDYYYHYWKRMWSANNN